MRSLRLSLLWVAPLLGGCVSTEGLEPIEVSELRDKIRGGWAGQMIGVSFGAPTEFRYLQRIIPEGELPEWSEERLRHSIEQDDLYVEMTFAEVLDRVGLDATTEDFGAGFRDSRYALWHANLAARRALRRGVAAGDSGKPRYNAHANDIDFQIEADFIGLMCPGLPGASNDLCRRVGSVMNYGDGLYGGMFVSGMYAAAFFEDDVRRVVESGLACLPSESPYAQVISDVLHWSESHPGDWQRVWRLIGDKWDGDDPCPSGALRPFNIDAKLNGAYIALGLLHGEGDFQRTLEISTRAGQDSDCNPSNAAGILGVMTGFSKIPEQWKQGISEVADEKFAYTDYSFNEIVESTEERAVEMVRRVGGRLSDQILFVRVQDPQPAELMVWDHGQPEERVPVSDGVWKWEGPWESESTGSSERRIARDAGAAVKVAFEGTGAIVVGPYLPDGGRFDVYLDGKKEGTFDVYSGESSAKGGEAVWHRFGLSDSAHTIRLEVTGEPFRDSAGSRVIVESLVIFR